MVILYKNNKAKLRFKDMDSLYQHSQFLGSATGYTVKLRTNWFHTIWHWSFTPPAKRSWFTPIWLGLLWLVISFMMFIYFLATA